MDVSDREIRIASEAQGRQAGPFGDTVRSKYLENIIDHQEM